MPQIDIDHFNYASDLIELSHADRAKLLAAATVDPLHDVLDAQVPDDERFRAAAESGLKDDIAQVYLARSKVALVPSSKLYSDAEIAARLRLADRIIEQNYESLAPEINERLYFNKIEQAEEQCFT